MYAQAHGQASESGFRSIASTLSVAGLSGIAKSTALESILRLYLQAIRHQQYSGHEPVQVQIHWLKIECPFDGSHTELCHAFFRAVDPAIGDERYAKRYRSVRRIVPLVHQIEQIASMHFVGVLIIDDLKHPRVAKTGGKKNMVSCFVNQAGTEDTGALDVRGMLDCVHFVHDLLNSPLGQVGRLRLRVAYQNRIRELGFGWGLQVHAKAFQEHLNGELDDAFLCTVVLALQRVSDEDAVRNTSTRAAESQSGRSLASPPSKPHAAHRGRIRDELSKIPKTTLEDLWRRANRITPWVYEHDRTWLVETLSMPATDGTRRRSSSETASPDDERFAAYVDTVAAELLARSGKPQQVAKERLLAALPVSVADTHRHREHYPRTLERVTDNRESTWHFSARRLWWACAVLGARGDAPLMFGAVVLSGVGLYAAQAIIEYCGWEHLLPLAANIDVPENCPARELRSNGKVPLRGEVGLSGGAGISTSEVRWIESLQARQLVRTAP
ncbi:AAA family ATPase [Paraburkholderia sp. EG286B]|uniref:AAA family ATPase n=1 Tax=Paraburkholderia sp. EG286B TaxID=3237011 RepID=UPI0034D34ED5